MRSRRRLYTHLPFWNIKVVNKDIEESKQKNRKNIKKEIKVVAARRARATEEGGLTVNLNAFCGLELCRLW